MFYSRDYSRLFGLRYGYCALITKAAVIRLNFYRTGSRRYSRYHAISYGTYIRIVRCPRYRLVAGIGRAYCRYQGFRIAYTHRQGCLIQAHSCYRYVRDSLAE
jgi:hypothetical protein